jgi:hypothetical protein
MFSPRIPNKNTKGRRKQASNLLVAASRELVSLLSGGAELDFLACQFRQHRYAILDGDPFELTVTNVAAQLNELTPTRRHGMCPLLLVSGGDHCFAIGHG